MWNWKKRPKSPFLTEGREGRRHPRYPSSQVSSALGEVVDLSAVGAAVRCEGKPPVREGQMLDLWIKSGRKTLSLRAKVIHRRRIGRKESIVGIEFLDLSPGMAAVLEKLARLGFIPSGNAGGAGVSGASVSGPGATGGGNGSQDSSHAKPLIRVGLNLPDHYGALEVPSDAGDDQIRASFRKLAARFHPDVNHEPGAADRFVAIQKAYEVLRDEKRRREYDAMVFGRSLPCA